jgi:hypothetical protein
MNGKMRKGRDRLESIAALLLSLAGLAERAATRSAPVRILVLWILRQAEAVAADFVDGAPSAVIWNDRAITTPDPLGYGPDDALALAVSLRLLALGVQAMAAEAGRLPDEASISGCAARMARSVLAFTSLASCAAERRDTS